MDTGTTTQVLAHRGASRAERENTLEAFETARRMGSDAVELDVRRSADGALVVHHDAHLADGRLICEIDSRDLPAHVPLLADALDACAGMWVNVEIKNNESDPDHDPTERVTAAVAAHLSDRGDHSRWLVSSFSRATVDAMRALHPAVRTAWLTVGVRPENVERTARDLASAGHSALHPWVDLLTRECVEAFHAQGLAVNTWTCDDPVRMAELIDWGIDGICTNVPDVCLGVRDRG
ncbi:MAG: glycerophosphodiester phosphodiesterase [Ilumatobacteraceae bacterium]